ncbi:OB-fold domain-containing protein [Dactylosporangium sp. NPDC051485]|uniref:Zn-ribbon domain-containing OB-fold protein n=1 Tax=Dactylosporangium sp. NPDC051485 TaxID=3154846 RepID=UPI00341EF95D
MNRAPAPMPQRVSTALTAAYWGAADRGELLYQRCDACGRAQLYPGGICRGCWSTTLSYHPAAGTGTVWTFTIAEVAGHPAWQARTPYCLAIVEIDEGPRLLTQIIGGDPYAFRVGQRVRLAPHAIADDGPPLRFMPC